MKVVGVKETREDLSRILESVQTEDVLVTRHGQPLAILVGVQGYDMEQVLLMRDENFWKMIDQRRKSKRTYSDEEMRRRLGLEPYQEKPRRRR